MKQRQLLFVHKNSIGEFEIDSEEESLGTKRFFGLGGVLKALILKSRFVAIDEIEASLHPSLVNQFLKMFLMNSSQSQLFCSTHNQGLMDLDYMRNDMIWFCEKKKMAHRSITAHRISSCTRMSASAIFTVPENWGPCRYWEVRFWKESILKRQKRKVTKAIAIVGEGMSEWLYFDYIRTDRRYPFELRPDLPKHSDYRTVFAHAKKLLSSGYDFVFCVVDVDTIVAQNKQEEFINACHSLDGKLIPITSNPCIEFWFLLYLWERPFGSTMRRMQTFCPH